MAGNSQRRGARRNPGSKKGSTAGSGGQRARGLRGRGPTPKAEERTGHPAARRARAAGTRGDGRGAAANGRGGARSARRGDDREVVAGRNAVVEALRAHVPVTTVYVAERVDVDDRIREVLRVTGDRRLPVLQVPRTELDRIAAGMPHQGVAATVPPYAYLHPDDLLAAGAADGAGPPLLVALDGVTDPRNLGAVVRSVAAFGGTGVVVPERRSAGVTAAGWKASAGALARVPVARAGNLTRALEAYKDAGVFVVGLDADADTEVGELELADEPLVLVVGSEGAGLSRLVREHCDLVAGIPMAQGTESLNAAVAAGIALYAVTSRRRRPR